MTTSDKANTTASQKGKTTPLPVPDVANYWYPNKSPDLQEIYPGYKGTRNYGLAIAGVVVFPIAIIYALLWTTASDDTYDLYNKVHGATTALVDEHPNKLFLLLSVLVASFVLALILCALYFQQKRTIRLVDFATFQPPDDLKVSVEWFQKRTAKVGEMGRFTPESVEFQQKIAARTGLGDETYFPQGIHDFPPNRTMQAARDEAWMVLAGCFDELFAKTGISPQQVDILIVNCSLFNPTPSIAAMIINKYKMRSNIRSFNLSGMGCSAGVISIDLAKDLLQAHKNSIAVVFSTENITQNWYLGNNKNMMVQNCLFRVGGAAIMLTNKNNMPSKYKLGCTVRVCKAANDKAYKSVYQEEDETGEKGVSLVPSRELLEVVGDALKTNMSILGPMVLPWSEQLKFFINLCVRKYWNKKVPAYIPDFKLAFQHFCIHAGGRAVIDGMESNLNLSAYDVEPSRATLYRYGNTSSSSIWYELNFIEKGHKVKKGDKVWQIAFGSGFKCNSAVWVAERNIS